MQKYVITPNDIKFKYEYSKIGLVNSKIITDLDLKNPIIENLLKRGKLNINPYHEKPQKPIKKETKKVENPTSKDENIINKTETSVKDEDLNLRKDGADINAKN